MLIRFRISNYLSFKDQVEFSMIPGRTKQHPNHIVSGGSGRNDIDLLRAGVIYGANASGKSNLIKAISFAKRFLIKGVSPRKPIPVIPFKLNKNTKEQPSKFEFEIRIDDKDYLYGFEANSERVLSEWLHQIKKASTSPIFERTTDIENNTTVNFFGIKYTNKKDAKKLVLFGEGTRPNRLFLTESIDRNLKYFENIYNWFNNLVIIFPHTRSRAPFDIQSEMTTAMVTYLTNVGTGVSGFDFLEILPESELPKGLVDDVTKDLKSGEQKGVLVEGQKAQRYIFSKDNNEKITVSKLVLKHKMSDCEEEATFDTDEESDGTNRLMDVLPILDMSVSNPRVFLIDELDRSLHPNLCYQLIQDFLANSSQSQLIVTTHESNLLTFDLLRRDEIWFVEKNQQGSSVAYSLEEFTPRYDNDVQKGYLLGRFGAIPFIGKKHFNLRGK